MVQAIGGTKSSTNLPTIGVAQAHEAPLAMPAVSPSDIGEAIAFFMVKIGREQRDAARSLRESAESMVLDAQRAQLDSMRSQARAELCAGLAGAAGSFAEAGVNLSSASAKQALADTHTPALDAQVKLDRLKALSAGISGTTRVFEASFSALALNAKTHATEAEQRSGNLARRIDTLRNDERDAQALVNAGVDALKSYEQRLHETRTAAIFR